MKSNDRQLIYSSLIDALNSISFLNSNEELKNASPERMAEFMAVKRSIREELRALANSEKPKTKKKSVFNTARYKTHDGERGSPDQWREAAKTILNINNENCLTTLGLTSVPASEEELKKVWRSAIRKCHPDLGGSADDAAKLNAAYELALSLYFSTAKMTKATRKDTGLRPQLLTPITEEEAEKYLQDNNWCLQEKKDGKHGVLKVAGGKVIAANKQGLEMAIPQSLECELLEQFNDVILDGELIGSTFHVFDVLEYLGTDYRAYNYDTRYDLLKRLFPEGRLGSLVLVPAFIGTAVKTTEYDKIKAQQKEGVVFKKLSAVFKEGKPDSGGDMVKCKFWATLSAIVDEKSTGKNSFISYVFDPQGKRVYLGHCTAIGKEMPKAGDVVELRYLYAYRGGKLIQPVYLGIRDDVSPEECTTKQLKFKSE